MSNINGNLIDVTTEPGNLSELEQQLAQAVKERAASAGNPSQQQVNAQQNMQQQQSQQRPVYIEEKFWTGNAEESLKKQHDAYVNLQSAYGRMANDLGTQRQLTDQLLEIKRTTDLNHNTNAQTKKLDGAELIERPDETLDSFFAPRIKEVTDTITNRISKLENMLSESRFMNKHSDYVQVGNDPAFVQWVNRSPYRINLANKALQTGDWSAADELMTEWKDIKSQFPQQQAQQTNNNQQNYQQQQQVNQAQVDNSLNEARKVALESNSSGAANAQSSGRIYRRADLIRLKLTKPDQYNDPGFQAEIMQAYRENRVK